VSLALAALASPADQPAKSAFVADLKAKYNFIGALNAAWGTSHTSWDDFAASTVLPSRDQAATDLKAFYTRTAETYFRVVRDAIKESAPHQLYLGCRFAWANPRAAAAAAKYCDVVSYNLYQRSIATFIAEGAGDVPLIIGEFHFGALDRGMFHTGLVPVADQADRAKAYSDYVRGALRHPQFVGTHWFQYQDQPTTGRVLDEENYQIGFVDIADTPYREMVESSRTIGLEMYRARLEGNSASDVPPGR
jgi:beta-galactosidase GanA